MTGHNIRIPKEAFGVLPQPKWVVERKPGLDALAFDSRFAAIEFVTREARACAIPKRVVSKWVWRARHVRYVAVCPPEIRHYTGIGNIVRAEPVAHWKRVWACLKEGKPLLDLRIRAIVGNRVVPVDQALALDRIDRLVRLTR